MKLLEGGLDGALAGVGHEEVLFFCLAMWLGGGMLYIWIIALIFYRYTFFPLTAANLAAPFLTVYLMRQRGYPLATVTALWVAGQMANALLLHDRADLVQVGFRFDADHVAGHDLAHGGVFRVALLAEVTTVAAAGFIVVWYFALDPFTSRQDPSRMWAYTVGSHLGDVLLLAAVASVVLRGAVTRYSLPVTINAVGLSVKALVALSAFGTFLMLLPNEISNLVSPIGHVVNSVIN